LRALEDYSFRGYQGTEAFKRYEQEQLLIGEKLREFFGERLQFYLRDVLHFRYDAVKSVLSGPYYFGLDKVSDLTKRCKAVDEICASPEFTPLFIAFKRIKNIIRQAEEKQFLISDLQEEEKFDSEAEIGIWKVFRQLASSYLPLMKRGQYLDAFRELAKVREPVDKLFDSVMVMVGDPEVRAKRLGLLNYLLNTFNTIADLSELAPDTK
jgi:glycyl-tRNA synthetase beta chain